jgi:hypothetical protein
LTENADFLDEDAATDISALDQHVVTKANLPCPVTRATPTRPLLRRSYNRAVPARQPGDGIALADAAMRFARTTRAA